MTDDFVLFPDPPAPGGDPAADADIALITAYLAHELTGAQIVAVENRLATDTAFRERVAPIIQGWTLPWSFAAGVDASQGQELSLGGSPRVAERRLLTPERKRSMRRIAAVIAFIVLPAIGFTQLVVYAATNVNAPGHEIARAIVPTAILPPAAPETRPRSPSVRQSIPLVDLSTPAATSTHTFRAVTGIKETAEGQLLVNDYGSRQLYLLDRSLAIVDVPLDSIPGSVKSWGPRNSRGAFYPYVGDSALLSQPGVAAMRVLNGRGQVVRGLDISFSTVGTGLYVGGYFDPSGRVVYAVHPENNSDFWTLVPVPASDFIPSPPMPPGRVRRTGVDANGNISAVVVNRPDSLPIVRADLDARRVDTVAWFGFPVNQVDANTTAMGRGRVVVRYGPDGKAQSVRQVINPLYAVDAWTLLSDGTIAIVRGRDYHVDWVRPNGTISSSPKLPFDWKALTDTDKQRLTDSTRACIDSIDAWAYPTMMAGMAKADSEGVALGRSGSTIWTPPPAPPRPACYPPKDNEGPPRVRSMRYEIAPLDKIADYYPPIGDRSALGDRDGNVWILPRVTKLSRQGELVYDVVNPERGLVRRVRLPIGRSITGFGKGGVVYLQLGNLRDGFVLERYEVKQ